MKVLSARKIGSDPSQWSGVSEDGRPVYARYSAHDGGGTLTVRVGPPGSRALDVPAAVREKPLITYFISTRAYDDMPYQRLREYSQEAQVKVFWPERLENEEIMIKRSEFLALDDLAAQAVQAEFERSKMSLPLHPMSRRLLEKAAEEAISRWLPKHANRLKPDVYLVSLCGDEDGLPVAEFVVSKFSVHIDPEEAAWVKILWGVRP